MFEPLTISLATLSVEVALYQAASETVAGHKAGTEVVQMVLSLAVAPNCLAAALWSGRSWPRRKGRGIEASDGKLVVGTTAVPVQVSA